MSTPQRTNGEKSNYQLLADGTFVIDDYNRVQPFASFFPGIAGLKGIPLWAFYVNRNQGIASFGIKNKNYSLMEFFPANTAYGVTATTGFRTFVKIRAGGATTVYEPFAFNRQDSVSIHQRMLVRAYEVVFEETNKALGLKTSVRIFTLPGEPLAALVRIVEFENIGKKRLECEVVDGLPKIIPYWLAEGTLKSMSYTGQAWATVTNFEKTVPFYKLKVEINDRPEVTEIREGNFYLSLTGNSRKAERSPVIIDPQLVFGEDLSYAYPHAFARQDFAVPAKQMGSNKYPAAMSFVKLRLAPGARQNIFSMAGHIESEEKLNAYARKLAASPEYFAAKGEENKQLVESLTGAVHTESAMKEFDLYCRQTYLDNLMRGGMPIILPAEGKKCVFYVYSRKHGDLERDYNNFQLATTYYSQGNGNFRDMNQNKRSDVFFTPAIGDANVFAFYNLIQLDGYNPLLVKGMSFFFNARTKQGAKVLKECVDARGISALTAFFAKSFEPGALLLKIEREKIRLKISPDKFLGRILANAEWFHEAEHGEGFWTDHWTYNLDILESYLAVYPEKEREILLEKKEFTFFDNAHVVVPRREKYVNANGLIRQFDAVVLDTAKAKMIRERAHTPYLMRTARGTGEVYRTTLLVKMICLMLNKLATLDSDGIGIEMEADKPSWYDALNGLPGIFGSSVPETFELKRMLQFLHRRLVNFNLDDYPVALPLEMHRFFDELERLLNARNCAPFAFWDRATTAKENYRDETKLGISGKETSLPGRRLREFIEKAIVKVDAGLAAAQNTDGLYYTYFSHEAASWTPASSRSHKGWPCVKVNKFKKHPLPLFLEAEVHYFKTEDDFDRVRRLHDAVRKSALYDRQLSMLKVNAPLESEPMDIGRCRVFTPGWLENESIWLHMEYKYLLELLKTGYYKEFFSEFRKAGVCYQDPQRYGRSILENSSFIVSSAFPDPSARGRGFVARLSGSTAEFIQMWLIMTQGPKPFSVSDEGTLMLEFRPVLPREFFTSHNIFSFTFLGTTLVRYHNPQRTDTFADDAVIEKMRISWRDGGEDTVEGRVIAGHFAQRIRNQEARAIDIFIV